MQVLVDSILVVTATVTGVGMIVPQVLRLRRTRSVAGVSGVWVGVGIALNVGWMAYAVSQGLWAIIGVSIGGVALYAVVAAQVLAIAGLGPLAQMARGAGAAVAVPALALAVGDWRLVGLMLGLSYSVQFAPAVTAAMRAGSVEGIAMGTWVMAWIEAVAWLGYGSRVGDVALVLGGAGGGVMASLVLVTVHRRRGRARAGDPVSGVVTAGYRRAY